ncbi:DUF397 domain-containing protein [Streptomyces sp. NPDC005805]|uniref:DUF397 domain-containing protein n=1 Tax=Streptomyces sp. NPDC005805 TaxID=3157068 RepID=UPI0033E08975
MQSPMWQQSSYCAQGEACLNVASLDSAVLLTESDDPDGVILRTSPAAFADLLRALRAGSHASRIRVSEDTYGTVRIHHPDSPGHAVTTSADKWHAFTLGVRAGEFDHLADPTTLRD